MSYEYIKHKTIHKLFAGPVGIIPKERNTKRKKNVPKCHVNSANGVGLRVKSRLDFFMYNFSLFLF